MRTRVRRSSPAKRGKTGVAVVASPFAELLDLPEPGWLIRGLVPQSSLTVLYGAPGSGKTFVALDWALSVATGQRWLAHEVTQGPVTYIAAKGVGGLPKRVRAWREENGEVSDEGFAALSPGVNLLDRADMETLRDELRTHAPKLIVVDTLAHCLIGGDENSPATSVRRSPRSTS